MKIIIYVIIIIIFYNYNKNNNNLSKLIYRETQLLFYKMPNFYEILGLQKDANDNEIKKAYRSLSLKHHPDRGGDTNIFQQINSAYETLSDPAKKHQYDAELNGFGGGMHGMPPEFQDINNIFNMMFGMHGMPGMPGMPGMHHEFEGPNIRIFHGHPFGGQNIFQSLQRPPPIIKNIILTLEQCYSGLSIPVEIERWVLQNDVKKNETETIYVTIPAGIDENEVIIIKDKGHVLNEMNKGDIKITIQINNTTSFKRYGLDIVYKKTISLKEALCGFSFDLIHLNGKMLCLNNNTNRTIIKPHYKKVIPNLGMNRNDTSGNLIIEFDVDFPNQLTEEQISIIEKTL